MKNQFYPVDYKIKKQFLEIRYVSFIFVLNLYLTFKLKIIKALELLNCLKIVFINHVVFKFIKGPKLFNFKYFKSLLIAFHIANMIVEGLFKSLIIKLKSLAFFSIKLKIQDQSFIKFILLKHFKALTYFIILQNLNLNLVFSLYS